MRRNSAVLAVLAQKTHLVEFLLDYGADVNISGDYRDKFGRYQNVIDGFFPLHVALQAFRRIRLWNSRQNYMYKQYAPRFAADLTILKLLVPRCDSFDLVIEDADDTTYQREPCVVHFFQAELELGWDDDFTTTKYLLRNGAVANFVQFCDCLFERKTSFKPLTTSFLQLLVLAGCTFDSCMEMKTKERTCNQLWYDEYIQPVLDKVEDLMSQPLSLQELSIMSIRQCIGSRQLWAKIDALPEGLPRHVKDMIQLKTYSPDKNGGLYVNSYDPVSWDFLLVSHCKEYDLDYM